MACNGVIKPFDTGSHIHRLLSPREPTASHTIPLFFLSPSVSFSFTFSFLSRLFNPFLSFAYLLLFISLIASSIFLQSFFMYMFIPRYQSFPLFRTLFSPSSLFSFLFILFLPLLFHFFCLLHLTKRS